MDLDLEQRISLDKLSVFREMYKDGYVTLHLDARSGVTVPESLKTSSRLRLRVPHDLINPARVSSTQISVMLSFNGQQMLCIVPWTSIFAIISEEGLGVLWSDGKVVLVRKPSVVKPLKLSSIPGTFEGCTDEVNEQANGHRARFTLICGGRGS